MARMNNSAKIANITFPRAGRLGIGHCGVELVSYLDTGRAAGTADEELFLEFNSSKMTEHSARHYWSLNELQKPWTLQAEAVRAEGYHQRIWRNAQNQIRSSKFALCVATQDSYEAITFTTSRKTSRTRDVTAKCHDTIN